MTVRPQDLVFYAGGECLQDYGVLVKRTSPGEEIVETFDRNSNQYYIDPNGVLKVAATDVPAVEWLDLDGDGVFETPVLLLEGERENLCLRSEELENAAWAAGGSLATVTADDATAPDGFTTADKVDDTGATLERRRQQFTVADDSEDHVATGFFRADTSAIVCLDISYTGGTALGYGVVVDLSDGTVIAATSGLLSSATPPARFAITALGSDWYRAEVAGANNGSGNTSLSVLVYPAWNTTKTSSPSNAATGAVHCWGMQLEKALFASSYMKTGAATYMRRATQFSYPHPFPPQKAYFYAKWRERGTIALPTGGRILELGQAANPKILLYQTGSTYRAFYRLDASNSSESNTEVAPSIDDVVEMLASLSAAGAPQASISVDGGAPTVGAAGSALGLGDAWGVASLAIGSDGNDAAYGFAAFDAVKIVLDPEGRNYTLAELQDAA